MVDGYNLSYLRDEATAAAYARDDYEAPLVAFWNPRRWACRRGLVSARWRVFGSCPPLAGVR